jgi:hypothetical protein
VRAIETLYRGYRFRSRLEARWAVFFDAAGIRWEYEPQGFTLADGSSYLPDFWLPGLDGGTWAEVKGNSRDWEACRLAESKLQQLCIESRAKGVLLFGIPPTSDYPAICFEPDHGAPYGFWITTSTMTFPARALDAARQARFEHGQVGAPRNWARTPA